MREIKIFLLFLLTSAIPFSVIYAQAEKTHVYDEFVKINEGAKSVKDAKIKKCTDIHIVNNVQDTLHIAYYDNTGNLTKEFIQGIDTTRKDYKYYFFNFSYIYDKDGKLTDKLDSTWQETIHKIVYYDDLSSITKVEAYLGKNKLFKEINYEYDDLVRLIESNEVNYNMSCKVNIKYAYDSYNGLAKVIEKNYCKDPEGRAKESLFTYKYDKNNNIVEKYSNVPGIGLKTETFKYDTKGHVTDGYYSNSKEEYTEFINTYDAKFNKIKVDKNVVIGEKINKYTVNLKYDNFGNFLEEQTVDASGSVVSARKLIYEFY